MTWFQQEGRRKELCRLADNHAHDCARRHTKYDRYFGSRLTHSDDQRCLIRQALQTAPLSQRVIQQERMAQIHGALKRLTPPERDLFAACYERGESAVEIAAYLGVSSEVVRKRHSRLRQRLNDLLLAAGWEEG